MMGERSGVPVRSHGRGEKSHAHTPRAGHTLNTFFSSVINYRRLKKTTGLDDDDDDDDEEGKSVPNASSR